MPYQEFTAHKPGTYISPLSHIFHLSSPTGDACSNDNSVFLGQYPIEDECKLAAEKTEFKVCGKTAHFADEGDKFLDNGSCKTGYVLYIDGKSYQGEKVSFDDDPCQQTCHTAAAFGTNYGEVIWRNVPICE
jgi:hypothetical protein